jgi:rhodanese-related sulfurtransferase
MPRSRLKSAAVFVLASVVPASVASLYAPPLAAREPLSLAAVEADVRADYPEVAQLTGAALADRLAHRQTPLLIDVREPDEYAVSHLPGAQRVDPGIWTRSFLSRYAQAARGRDVVFYCSVGVRSSELADAVQNGLEKAGARAVYNLEGGIFAWHNARRALTDAHGATDFVHPYDAHWGKLLMRNHLIRNHPARSLMSPVRTSFRRSERPSHGTLPDHRRRRNSAL